MFRGNHQARVDEKGRLKLPAKFKRVIDKKYGKQFYIISLDENVSKVYPLEEWEQIEQKLASPSSSNPTKKELLDRVRYDGYRVEMDGRGRLLIPQLLGEWGQTLDYLALMGHKELLHKLVQIMGPVAVRGNKTHLSVRNLGEIEEQQRGFGPDAPVFAPLKPRPHLRSGAIALPEPTHADDTFTEIKAIRISK
jgi:transcriptional regulator MraZ